MSTLSKNAQTKTNTMIYLRARGLDLTRGIRKRVREPYSSLKFEYELLSVFIVVHGNVDTHAWVEQRHE
jgi:hypothetical protein